MANKASKITSYSEEQVNRLLEQLATGKSLNMICKAKDMPTRQAVRLWCLNVEGFQKRYNIAREQGYDRIAERTFDIAENINFEKMSVRCARAALQEMQAALGDTVTAEQWKSIREILLRNAVDPKFAGAEVRKAELRINTSKWFLSKLFPTQYGERVALDHTHKDKELTPEEVQQEIDSLQKKVSLGSSQGKLN